LGINEFFAGKISGISFVPLGTFYG
jgi:hypothetical protein